MKRTNALAIFAVAFCCTTATQATTPETVPVGNIGNIGEFKSKSKFGTVDYHYRIGITEVTNAHYTDFLNAVADTDTHALFNANMRITQTGSSDSFSYTAYEGQEQDPVTYVSFWDAARYSNWLHNGQPTGAQELNTTEDGAYFLNHVTDPTNRTISREPDARWFIPSEDEWYKAAYHKNDGDTGNYFDYPTSSDTAPTAEAPAGGTNSANYIPELVAAWPFIDWFFDTTPVGAYLNSDSPYGTFDQGGNVWEWNEDLFISLSRKVPSSRGIRGGSYLSPGSHDLLSSHRDMLWPILAYNDIGFRVASVPEPSSLLLGALGGVGMLVRKRR